MLLGVKIATKKTSRSFITKTITHAERNKNINITDYVDKWQINALLITNKMKRYTYLLCFTSQVESLPALAMPP